MRLKQRKNITLLDLHPEIENLKGKLSLLAGCSADNMLDSDEWRFYHQSLKANETHILDFSLFNLKCFSFFETVDADIDGNKIVLTPSNLAKLIFLLHCEGKTSAKNFKSVFNLLLKTFAYLVECNKLYVRHNDYEAYFEYLIMNEVSQNGITRRYTPLAYSTVFKTLNLEEVFHAVQTFGIGTFLLQPITKIQKNKALSKTVSIIGDGLTLTDYKEGGSFNFLTLDVGRYYAEHLATFFNENYLIAHALKRTQRDTVQILREVGLAKGNSFGPTIINKVLSGHSLNSIIDYCRDSKRNKYQVAPNKVRRLFKIVLERFEEHYLSVYQDNAIYSLKGLRLLAKKLKLPESQDIDELLMSLLHVKEQEDISLSVSTILNESSLTKNISISEFINSCDQVRIILSNKIILPNLNESFYKNLGIERSESHHEIQVLLRSVEAAGTTSFESLTAWRETEYGFSFKDISISRNKDLLDGIYHPLRFKVFWFVPKTNGETKLEREIILPAYRIAYQLNQLVASDDKAPCLYSISGNKGDPQNSSAAIITRTSMLWEHFVNNYKGFVELDCLDRLRALVEIDKLSGYDQKELKRLIQKYPDNHHTLQLRHTMEKVTAELPRIEATKKVRAEDVFAYITQNMEKEQAAIWDEYLSNETKKHLLEELKILSADDIPKSISVLVFNQIRENCVYPSPHALRHMWVEAVLRRFSGDIGWFIRSNFKHITQSMFMRYLRNKNNKLLAEMAKRQVIHSLLRNHVLSRDSEGHRYSGEMEKYLQRLSGKTIVSSLDQLNEQIEQYAALEIEDIKSNSWGYCILKRRNKYRTKCAVEGEPQRQNASPEFCLGCMNNYIEDGHTKGIMFLMENHVKSLKNPHTPNVFKERGAVTVQNAIKVLQKMDKNSDSLKNEKYINYLQSALAANIAI